MKADKELSGGCCKGVKSNLPAQSESIVYSKIMPPSKFAAIGVVNTILDCLTFFVLIYYGVAPIIANIVSFSVGALNSFILNASITFANRGSHFFSISHAARFFVVTIICLASSTIGLAVSLFLFPVVIAKAFSVALSFILGYALNSRYVFVV